MNKQRGDRGKDKSQRKTEGYTIRWLKHRLDKQRQKYEERLAREKLKHINYTEWLKHYLGEGFKEIDWSVRNSIKEDELDDEMFQELENESSNISKS